jgi:uncharacterized surface protein with fasciclin (FAS1) repeats
MFRRTRTTPVAWEQPEPPGRAAALAVAGVAGTISLVVGGLMWAGTAVSQPRTFDAGGTAGAPASRVGIVTVPVDGTASTSPDTAPLSPVPLPPPPEAGTVPPAPASVTSLAPTLSYVPQTAAPATVATLAATAPAPSSPPTTAAIPGTVATSTAPSTSTTLPTTTSTTTSTTSSTTTTTTSTTTTVAPSGPSLWGAVQADPGLSRFAELVQYGDVAASLEVDAAHTLIAPDDDAIAAYASTPEGQAEFADPQAARAFVLRHLVLVELDASALFALDRVESATGEWLTVDGTARTVGGASLTTVDVPASNGLLHVASRVMLPGATA